MGPRGAALGGYSALAIAKWFVAWGEEEPEAALSNLKLQKLLYYAQGHHLARHGRPLFDDQVQAWSHGPVVPAVYHEFKRFGSGELGLDESDPFDWDDIDEDTTQFLIGIWEAYGSLAAWRLRNMTHGEAPWSEHFVDGQRSIEIPHEDMRRWFNGRTATA